MIVCEGRVVYTSKIQNTSDVVRGLSVAACLAIQHRGRKLTATHRHQHGSMGGLEFLVSAFAHDVFLELEECMHPV